MRSILLAFLAIFFVITEVSGQDLEKKWQIEAVKDFNNINLFDIGTADTFQFKDGEFSYTINSLDSLGNFNGNFIRQSNLLVFYYDSPLEKTDRYRIRELSDSTLILVGKKMSFSLTAPARIASEVTWGQRSIRNKLPSFGWVGRGHYSQPGFFYQ